MMVLALVAIAAAAAAAYFALRDDELAACLDPALSDEERALAKKLLLDPGGKEKLPDLQTRIGFMRVAAGIAGRRGHGRLAKCLTRKANQLDELVAKTTGKPAPPPEKVPSIAAKKKAKPAALKVPPEPATEPRKQVTSPTVTAKGLPAKHGAAREKFILAQVRAGEHRPIKWHSIKIDRDGHTGFVFVSTDAVMLKDGVRFNVRHDTAERVAQHLGAFLPTSRISDLAWTQAKLRLTPHFQKINSTTAGMYKHSRKVDQDIGGRAGLARPVGKTWATSNKILQAKRGAAKTGVNFGWHWTKAASVTPKPYKSPGGLPVVQPLSKFHSVGHTDYSQVVTLVRADAVADNKPISLEKLLRDPVLSKMVSDEGPLKLVRHPAVVPELVA